MSKAEKITLSIGGQEFTLRLDADEREDAETAVRLVEEKMKELEKMGAMGAHRLALMVAFQFAFEASQAQRHPLAQPQARADLERRIQMLIQASDKALAEH